MGAVLACLLFAAGASAMNVEQAAERIHAAAAGKQPFPVLSSEYPGMTEADSYAVQKAYSLRRLNGARPAGFKAGLTTERAIIAFNPVES